MNTSHLKLYNETVEEALKILEPESVQLILVDPPFGILGECNQCLVIITFSDVAHQRGGL